MNYVFTILDASRRPLLVLVVNLHLCQISSSALTAPSVFFFPGIDYGDYLFFFGLGYSDNLFFLGLGHIGTNKATCLMPRTLRLFLLGTALPVPGGVTHGKYHGHAVDAST